MVSNDDFSEFERMKNDGVTPQISYLYSKKIGLDPFAQIRMLRTVYDLTIEGAKEVTVTASGESSTLSEHQEKLLAALRDALE